MLITFDFTILQLRYLKAAADQIASFRPDGLGPAELAAMLAAAKPVRADYVARQAALNTARAGRRNGIDTLHDLCVAFTTQARSRFRKDRATGAVIAGLPTADQTFQQTITRADATVAAWAVLPKVGPAPGIAFTVAQGAEAISLAAFTAVRDGATAADEAIPGADQAFQRAEGDLNEKMDDLEDFVSAALALGRSQYAAGTAERNIIDAVPTEPAQQPPAQATIASATASGPGSATLTFSAKDATSYDVLHRAPGATAFTKLAEDIIETSYPAAGLAPGTHGFQILGQNSRGPGPTSTTSVVNVG